MKYDTLYKRTSTGAIQVWWLEQNGSKYRSHSGQKDGKIVTSEWTECKGKNIGRANETTPTEQATAEITSKYKKQLDRSYRLDVNTIDTLKFKEPMLAKNYEDRKNELKFPVYVQPKLDGMRDVTRNDGQWSRKGKQIMSAPHIRKALQPLFDKYPAAIVDGELYADKYNNDFNAIISLAKKTKPTAADLAASKAELQYWVYDLPHLNEGDKLTFKHRNHAVKQLIQQLKSACIVYVPTYVANSQQEVDDYLQQFLGEGFEGVIIRTDSPYEWKRSKNLLKYKNFIDEEYTILDIEEGKGNRSGTAASIKFKTKDGKPFSASMSGTRAYVTEMWQNKKQYIGLQATVKYFQMTPDGVPRFPVVKAVRDYE